MTSQMQALGRLRESHQEVWVVLPRRSLAMLAGFVAAVRYRLGYFEVAQRVLVTSRLG